MQPIINTVNNIIYKIYKKKNPLLANIIINWQKIAGAKYMNNSLWSCMIRVNKTSIIKILNLNK